MRLIIKYLFQLHLIQGSIEPTDILNKWHVTWISVAVKSGLSDDTITTYQSQGYNALTNLLSKIKHGINVIDVNMPWHVEWDLFNIRIEGTILALTAGALNDKRSRSICIIDCLPSYPTAGGSPAAFEIYSIAREAVIGEVSEEYKGLKFKTQLIDPFTGDIKTVLPNYKSDPNTIIGVALQQMAAKLTLPNYQPHCRRCPFINSCSPKHLSDEALNHPTWTTIEIERSNGITRI